MDIHRNIPFKLRLAQAPSDIGLASLRDAVQHLQMAHDHTQHALATFSHLDDATIRDWHTAFIELAAEGAPAYTRERTEGHFTGSAWLVSKDGERVLLTHHKKLNRWLQLGGHADGDMDLSQVALKEAEEESGLTDLKVLPALFDIDLHLIPEHKGVPEHRHYDARYVVVATGSEDFQVSEESLDLAWRDIEAIASDASMDVSLQRMARRWLTMRAESTAQSTLE